jgi:hypothetical protein
LENVSLLLVPVRLMWQSAAPSNDDMSIFEEGYTAWQCHFKEHFVQSSASRCLYDNFHKPVHAREQAIRDGGFSATCTGPFERSHTVFAKNPARRHNRKGDVEQKMLGVLRNADQLRALVSHDSSPQGTSTTSSGASGSVTRVNLRSGISVTTYFNVLSHPLIIYYSNLLFS